MNPLLLIGAGVLAWFLLSGASAGSVTRPGGKLTPTQWITLVAPLAKALQDSTGIPMVASIAQSGLESNWGNNDATITGNNPFGITKGTWTGPMFGIYRQYDSLAAGWQGYGDLISKSTLYAPAMDPLILQDPNSYITTVAALGYNSNPSYAADVIACYPQVKKVLGS
jgi:flagellum-specific peptidoglycan hydrolase FlgJ